MDFRQRLMTKKTQNAFIKSMKLGKQQALFFVSDLGESVEILGGLIGLIFVTCLCAYLLIYNIMYLSVAGRVRHYGLLQTIGMTERQNRLCNGGVRLVLSDPGDREKSWNPKWIC